ncbi:anthocyanidin O-glucosyltransferase [Salix suchowensis]|nr:anthocyanidin O-glucosyltransferase [Salix suchowensis]
MKKAELVLIPIPAMGHIVSAVEIAKLLVQRDDRLSTTIFIYPTRNPITTTYSESLAASTTLPDRLRVINLPSVESKISDAKPQNQEHVSRIKTQSELSPGSPQFAGFIFDAFATGLKDLANEFDVPWYAFCASDAAYLGWVMHLKALQDEQGVDLTELGNSDSELEIPSLASPIPAKCLPLSSLVKETLPIVLEMAGGLTEAKGILVNTFLELELHAVNSLSNGKTPRVYPVGPIVKHEGDGRRDVGSDGSKNSRIDIMEWLDDQTPSSVLFLCFGSRGSFRSEQVKEIACALERSGHRFLWSLRKPSPSGELKSPSDYENFQEVLPEGFLDRTAKIGKVIGWAPQVDILAHQAVGGFASHCGWNSILESIWFGVPIVRIQQFNAFYMVIELGLGVEIKMDYTMDFQGDDEIIVSADDIMRAIKQLMEEDKEIRKKVKEMSRISEKTLMPGGSSHSSLGHLIDDIIENLP